MSIQNTASLVSEAYLEEVAVRGRAIYDAKLKSLLEPAHNNEFVVIHVDTEDYAVGPTFTHAKREMRQRHPLDGRLMGMKIGAEPEYELAKRLIASTASWVQK